jgi:hypothetical protein
MNWLFPGFLAGGVLITLPVVLHFLRRRQKVLMVFPSLRYLGETALRDTRRHQLRRWATLLLRCLVIALLAGAFARPFWIASANKQRQAMVIAIDNSMSMQTTGRWEKAQSYALEQLAQLQAGDQSALLVMNPAPVWLVPMTDDLELVRAALKSAKPGFEKTHYANALRAGSESLAGQAAGTKTLVWMADEQRLGWFGVNFAQTLAPGVRLRFIDPAPPPKRQAAIVALQWVSDLGQTGLQVTLRLFEPATDERRIEISAGQTVLAKQTVKLRAGDNKINLSFVRPESADGFRVALDADDLAADDVAWIVAPRAASAKVLLDTGSEADFLTHALRSTQKLSSGGFTPETLPAPGQPWPTSSVLVLRNGSTFRAPQLGQLDRFVAEGGSLWIFLDGSPEQTDWLRKKGIHITARRASQEPWHLRDWDAENPMLAAFKGQSLLPLLSVEFYQGFDLAGDQLASVANWPDGKCALAEWNQGDQHLLVAGFAPDRKATDWPAQPSFVPFVERAVHSLGSVSMARSEWRVGDTIPLPASDGQWRALDSTRTQPDRNVHNAIRAETPGLYEFSGGGVRKVFAVNILPEESDLAPWPKPEQFAALESTMPPTIDERRPSSWVSSNEIAEGQQRIWWWMLAVCSVAMITELALANKTAL